MHQHGTNTRTKLKLLRGDKLPCTLAGKLSPKCGAEGSCLAPVSTGGTLGCPSSMLFPSSLAVRLSTQVASSLASGVAILDAGAVGVGVPGIYEDAPQGAGCWTLPACPLHVPLCCVLMSPWFDWQNDPSCSAERRPLCLDSVIM